MAAPAEIREESREEEDQRLRSTKKAKGGEHGFSNASSQPISYADIGGDPRPDDVMPNKKSYMQSVIGGEVADNGRTCDDASNEKHEDWIWSQEGMHVEEKMRGKYECPEIILSKNQEERICRPWKKGLIVKLLGRKIRYKALETRLAMIFSW